MTKILVVEDSRMFARLLKSRIEKDCGWEVEVASTRQEVRDILESRRSEFFMTLLDLCLPDAPEGETLDDTLKAGLPTIVFSAVFDETTWKQMWRRRVVDYVVKGSHQSIDYVLAQMRRVWRNQGVKVLVVDDSSVIRRQLRALLSVHQYEVFEAEDGVEALAVLEETPDIRLMVVDYQMPRMDGCRLTEEVRHKHSKEDLSILGVSGSGDETLSARFLKAGANDFILKPFTNEEFYCRVSQNIELLERIDEIREASHRDYLTRLYNRRYFFDLGRHRLAEARRSHADLAVAILDIDFFKKVNDAWGHDAGDAVLVHVAGILVREARAADIVARFGGEEFCILAGGADPEKAFIFFERVREAIEAEPARWGEQTIPVTTSIGVCPYVLQDLEAMIAQADAALYAAKEGGRNRVVLVDLDADGEAVDSTSQSSEDLGSEERAR